MYMNSGTEKGVNKTLKIVFIIITVGIITVLVKVAIGRLDSETGGMTLTSADENDPACSEDAIRAMQQSGVPIPVKCKKK